jgi:hypothetical protein
MRTMRSLRRGLAAVAILAGTACSGGAQAPTSLVRSSDPRLAALASELLPDLARRAGLELHRPVRIEERNRAELERYLRHKLDQDLPEALAREKVQSYALLGLVPDTLNLRALLLTLYTEQVAGFYDPDSTALFVMDDQPESQLKTVLVHELVHAVQDQTVNLNALTDPRRGNDRVTAAEAAIEGEATLVMIEYMTEQMQGGPVDLSNLPGFTADLRPNVEAMKKQFPALADAPPVIQESLLFPYVAGTGYVLDLWRKSKGRRVAPFGPYLPQSTEQVITHDLADKPVDVKLHVTGARVVHEDDLGRLEAGVFMETHVGELPAGFWKPWGGDRYALVEAPDGTRGLVWVTAWDDAAGRDSFIHEVSPALSRLPQPATLTPASAEGRPVAVLRVRVPHSVGLGVSIGR